MIAEKVKSKTLTRPEKETTKKNEPTSQSSPSTMRKGLGKKLIWTQLAIVFISVWALLSVQSMPQLKWQIIASGFIILAVLLLRHADIKNTLSNN